MVVNKVEEVQEFLVECSCKINNNNFNKTTKEHAYKIFDIEVYTYKQLRLI